MSAARKIDRELGQPAPRPRSRPTGRGPLFLRELRYRQELGRRVTTKEAKTGTGLGLYISRKIIRDHGGDLDLTDSDRDETVFQIRLPLWRPEGAQDSEQRAAGAGLG